MIGLLTRLLLCAVLGIAFFRQAESAAAKRPKLDLTGAQAILSELGAVDVHDGRVEWERVHEISAALNILAKSFNSLSTAATLNGIEEAVDEIPDANRRLKAVDTSGFTGVRIRQNKAIMSMGSKEDVQIFRVGDGELKIKANKVDFLTTSLTVNGQAIGSGTAKQSCAKGNGGCHKKRKCKDTAAGTKCGDCAAGYTNDGAKGCKATKT